MRSLAKAIIAGGVTLSGLCVLAAQRLDAADTPPVVSSGFEDGTTQGWIPRGGGVTLASVDEAAKTGLRSLKTAGRTATWQGPSRDLLGLLQRDTIYQVSAAVRLVSGQPASTIKLTVERVVTGETSSRYDTVAASATNGVTDASWVTLGGTYSVTSDVSRLLLYVESSDPTSQYYLDDVRVADLVPDQSGIVSDFEDGTLAGYTTLDGVVRYWSPRGGVTLTNVTDDAHGGTHSLLTTGRTSTWQGPSLNVLGKMTKGFRYRITVWVKLAPGQTDTNLRVSVQRNVSGTPKYDTVVNNTLVTASQWIKLSARYTLPTDADALSVYVETQTSTNASFLIDDFSLTYSPPLPIQTEIPSVREVLADAFLFGGAIEPAQTASPYHVDLMKKHLGSLTAGNAMKTDAIHPSEATYSFTNADAIADFARANGMTMRGHTLQWHSQNPTWLFKDAAGVDLTPTPENKELMLERLESHIRTVVARYDDVVSSWDVVNEVIDPSQPDGLRRSKWYELTGPDYIDRAFQVAREVAKPEAHLCINDYSTTDPARRQALLTVVQGLLERGVPVDCVGHQMHVNIEQPSIAEMRTSVETFAALGLDNQITEMDVSVYTNSTDKYQEVPQNVLLDQGYRYRDIFRELRRLKDSISSVTLWGIADDNTWLKTFPIARLDLPLLFDEDLQAKPAYWGVVDPAQLPVRIQTLTTTAGRPRIDGRADVRWRAVKATDIVTPDGNVAGSFKTLWDQGHLYVLVDVDDTTRNWGDAVEVFVDELNDKAPVYGVDDAHYTFARYGHPHWHHGPRSWVGPRFGGGYRVEAAIPLRTPAALGQEIGFDIRLRDGAAPGVPVSWNDHTNSQDNDTSKLGVLRLVEALDIAKAVWGTPEIDGVEDAVWARAHEISTETWVLGTSGSTARVKTLWDTTHLYVFAQVTDSLLSKASANPWEQDSLEIFVDQNDGKTTAYEADDGQYRVNYENTQTFGGAASADTIVSATQIVPGGYVVEAAIALDAIQPRPGTLIGFDVQVNNDELGDGVRASVATWSDPTGQSYRNTSKLGTLQLTLGHGAGSWPPGPCR